MKKLKFFTLLAFVLAFGLCSCSSNDEEPKKEELSEAQVLGTWNGIIPIKDQVPIDRGLVGASNNLNVVMTFEAGGVGSTDNIKMTGPAKLTYKIDGKTLNVKMSINERERLQSLKVLSINDKTMDVQFVDDKGVALYDGQTITFIKAVGTLDTQILGTWEENVEPTYAILVFNKDLSGSTSFFGESPNEFKYVIDGKNVVTSIIGDETNVIELRVRIIDATTLIGRLYNKTSGKPLGEDRDYIFTKVVK